MKTRLIIIVLLTLIPSIIYCQEETLKENRFHFIDAGLGASYSRSMHGAFNIGLSNGLGKNMANFIDYNMAFGKSQTLFQEINFKIGPYVKYSDYSYISLSAGMSLMRNTQLVEYKYDNFYHFYSQTYSEGDYLLSIPIQLKINMEVYKGWCFGLKGTFNKMIDKGVENKGTVLMYLAFGW